MSPFNRQLGAIAAINIKAAVGSVCGVLAWHLWPARAVDWHFVPISIFLGLIGTVIFIGCARRAHKLHTRDKAVRAYLAQGAHPKSARLAPGHMLRNAGMLDD